jgi:DNA replication and repair protein RecF
MSLKWLTACNFRNLVDIRLDLAPGINLVHGDNGSGKTSLLESCYFLSTARSFRSSSLDPVIQRGIDSCLVRGEVRRLGQSYRIGIVRERSGAREIRLNEESVARASELARVLPTLLLGPESVDLLLGPPALRRNFLNWGLFHVEPGFSGAWEEANRCLRHRNQLLRNAGSSTAEFDIWSAQLASLAEKIDEMRKNYLLAYLPTFQSAVSELTGMSEVSLEYDRGWSENRSLNDIYQEDLKIERKRGFTQKGFQRADVRITVAGQAAVKVCSRGELKSLVWGMLMAQGGLISHLSEHGQDTLYLVDDMASEFDHEHRQRVCSYLAKTQQQVILTGVDRATLIDACEGEMGGLFHVKHGAVEVQEK